MQKQCTIQWQFAPPEFAMSTFVMANFQYNELAQTTQTDRQADIDRIWRRAVHIIAVEWSHYILLSSILLPGKLFLQFSLLISIQKSLASWFCLHCWNKVKSFVETNDQGIVIQMRE